MSDYMRDSLTLKQALMERSNTPEAPEPEETPVTEEKKPRGWWSRLFS
ncbi:hypothetical protein [Pontibacter pamirensis]|nr:hypothetical protein [Pontibacter pamirensis]